jgi:hypothetical protein
MKEKEEAKYRAAKSRLEAAPDDLAALKEFAEASKGVDRRFEGLDALQAAYKRNPSHPLYAELRSICTFPEFQAIPPPPDSAGPAPEAKSRIGREILPRRSFPLMLDQVILYPVQDGLSIFILLCCSLLFAVASVFSRYGFLGWAIAAAISGYVFAYFWTVVTSSGNGEKGSPGWPDFSDVGDLFGAFGQWLMVWVACLGPALVLLIIGLTRDGGPGVLLPFAVIGLALIGLAYYPMALMLAGFTHDLWQAFNFPTGLRTILKIPADYLICLGFIVGSYLAAVVIEIVLLTVARQMPLVPWFLIMAMCRVLDTYLLIVQMRAVGLLYYAREKDLGWFSVA